MYFPDTKPKLFYISGGSPHPRMHGRKIGRLWEATLNWGKEFSFRKGVVLEIVLLRRKVDMMEKTFSSSFVRDCSSLQEGYRMPKQQHVDDKV